MSEHEHNDWRYVRVAEALSDYFYARCRICNVLARRKPNTQTWELLEDKPTYAELEQQLAQARALLERLATIGEVPPVTGDLPGILRDTRAFLAPQKEPSDGN